MRIHRMIACVIVPACASIVFAGAAIDLDYAAFRGDSTRSYVEIYAAIQRDVLTFRGPEDSLRADFNLIVILKGDSAATVIDTFAGTDWIINHQSPSSGQFFPYVFQFLMQPGDYQLRAVLHQYDEFPIETLNQTIQVRGFTDDTLSLSDPQLGCELEVSDEASMFVKNGFRIVPNPTAFYGTQLPLFYFYLEAYGLEYDSTATDSIAVFRKVYHAETGTLARPEHRRNYQKSGGSAVIADGFPAYTLQTGTYRIELRVLDYLSGKTATISKRFFCYRPDDFAEGRLFEPDSELQARLLQTDSDILEFIDPDSALTLMKYALTRQQARELKGYTTEGKRNFLREFWFEKGTDDPGAANRYFARVAEANRRFGFLNRAGWKSDRGRILIMNGEPDQILRRYASLGVPDHEVWNYDRIQGGVQFVFLDRSGIGDPVLVHSTMPGEIYNPSWAEFAPGSRGLEYR